MFKRPHLFLVLGFIFVCSTSLHADTVYLKNGRQLKGLIKSENNDSIDLEVCAGVVKFKKSEIEKTEKSGSEESDAIRQKWEKQKRETEGAKEKWERRMSKIQEEMQSKNIEEVYPPKKVKFSEESQGLIVKAQLNRRVEASLVLDTGASVIMLRKNIAQKLGLDLSKSKPDAKVTVADGRQINAKHVILESVKVENVEANDVEAAIFLDDIGDIGFSDGLLGLSFLNRFNFKIDQKEKKLILEKIK